jgi:hypothetical protein
MITHEQLDRLESVWADFQGFTICTDNPDMLRIRELVIHASALIAAARAGIAARTVVKPLVWQDDISPDHFVAFVGIDSLAYYVFPNSGSPGKWIGHWHADLGSGKYDSEAAAKAACEADWQARIAPALLPPPPQP